MKTLIIALAITFTVPTFAQEKEKTASVPDKNKKVLVVDASCGQCKLGLPGKSCDLAIRLNGKAYFVDGSNIDSHGDAHTDDGFCNSIRKAEVQGEVVDNRFKATYFKLVPEKKEKKG